MASALFTTALTSNTSDSDRTITYYCKEKYFHIDPSYFRYSEITKLPTDAYKVMDLDNTTYLGLTKTLTDSDLYLKTVDLYWQVAFIQTYCSRIYVKNSISNGGDTITVSLKILDDGSNWITLKTWSGNETLDIDTEISCNRNISQIKLVVSLSGSNLSSYSVNIYEITPKLATDNAISFDFYGPAWTDANGFPKNVTQYQQRVLFSNTDNDPDTIWATETGELYSFHQAIDPIDSDEVTAVCSGKQSIYINNIVGGIKALFSLTRLGEYVFNSTALTPSDNGFSQHTAYGSTFVEPCLAGGFLFFVERISNAIRTFSYDYASDGYNGDDLTYLSKHFFEGKTIKQMAWQQKPYNTLWVLFDDGSLVYATIAMEQQLIAWQKVEFCSDSMDIMSIASIPGNEQDDLYAIMRYLASDGIYHNHLVKLSAIQSDLGDMCYLDLAKNITATEDFTDITLDTYDYYYNKDNVIVMSGGEILTGWILVDNRLTLQYAKDNIWIGLKYNSYIRLLPLATNGNGLALRQKSRISNVEINMLNSWGGYVNVKNDSEITNIPISYDGNERPVLTTGWVRLHLKGSVGYDPQLEIHQELPYPMTLLDVITERD